MITLTIRDALLADLGDITEANGHPVIPVTVYTEPVMTSTLVRPALELYADDGGNSEADTFDTDSCRQQYRVRLQVQTREDAMHLLDSVRNVIQRLASNVRAVDQVDDVGVSWEGAPSTDESVISAVIFQDVLVEVIYHIELGSA